MKLITLNVPDSWNTFLWMLSIFSFFLETSSLSLILQNGRIELFSKLCPDELPTGIHRAATVNIDSTAVEREVPLIQESKGGYICFRRSLYTPMDAKFAKNKASKVDSSIEYISCVSSSHWP